MNKVELQNLVGGQLQEKFEHAFEKVLENLQDPNTSFKIKRGITIILFKTKNVMMCLFLWMCPKSLHHRRA